MGATENARTWLIIATLVGATGCDDTCERAAANGPALTLGIWTDRFVAIDDGHVLTAFDDRRGGQHVWVSLQAEGIDPGNRRPLREDTDVPRTLFELVHISSGRLAGELHAPSWVGWTGNEELAEIDAGELSFSWRGESTVGAIMTSGYYYPEYHDTEYDDDTEPTSTADATTDDGNGQFDDDVYLLTATVTDACGTRLSAERQVEIRR